MDELAESIRGEARNRAHAIHSEATAEAERIVAEAEKKALQTSEEYRKRADARAAQILQSGKSRSRIDAKALYQSKVNEAIAAAAKGMEEQLDTFIGNPEYKKLLLLLQGRVHSELGSAYTIEARKEDLPLLKAEDGIMLKAARGMKGGLVAYSNDGKQYLDYSLEEILRRISGRVARTLSSKMEKKE